MPLNFCFFHLYKKIIITISWDCRKHGTRLEHSKCLNRCQLILLIILFIDAQFLISIQPMLNVSLQSKWEERNLFQVPLKYGRPKIILLTFSQSLGGKKSHCVHRDLRNELEILPAVQDSNAVLSEKTTQVSLSPRIFLCISNKLGMTCAISTLLQVTTG